MRVFRRLIVLVFMLPLYLFSQENSNNYSAGAFFLYYTSFEEFQYEPFVRGEIEGEHSVSGVEYYCTVNKQIEADNTDPRHTTVHNMLFDTYVFSNYLFFEGECAVSAGGYRYNEGRARAVPGIAFGDFYLKSGGAYSLNAFILDRRYIRHTLTYLPETGFRNESILIAVESPLSKERDESGNYYTCDPSLRFRGTIKPLFFYAAGAGAFFSEKEGIEARIQATLGLSSNYGDISVAYTLSKMLASKIEKRPDHLVVAGVSGRL